MDDMDNLDNMDNLDDLDEKSFAYLTHSSEGEASCEGDNAALSEQTASNDGDRDDDKVDDKDGDKDDDKDGDNNVDDDDDDDCYLRRTSLGGTPSYFVNSCNCRRFNCK